MTPATDTPADSTRPPIIWSIAGHDTAGGAGLSADQRAADALGAHLCPVVAAITAQHSRGVEAVYPVPTDQLEAQLAALSHDLPPRAIKTGLLGSVATIEAVARWVDKLRASCPPGTDPHRHLALVVDPVLRASSGGAAFTNAAIVAAYRQHLLPRATLITPNRAEALALLGAHREHEERNEGAPHVPALAQALLALGTRAIMITGGDAEATGLDRTHSADWLLTPHASGWLVAPRVATPHHHGTGCTLASGIAAALALGHVEADACVLGKMLTHHALMHSHAAGQGRGPVVAHAGFAQGPGQSPGQGGAPLPMLGLGEAMPHMLVGDVNPPTAFAPFSPPSDGLYGIVDRADMAASAYAAGLGCVQLRIKRDAAQGTSAVPVALMAELEASASAAARHNGQLFINDHWRAALALLAGKRGSEGPGAFHVGIRLGVHLGQEDLLALTPSDQAALLAHRDHLMLGLSSHSLWELARAAGWGPSYIACGPLRPTTTKDMPWRPQGADNLSWWVRHSPVPVVGIGGLLTPDDLAAHAGCGAAALCVVRALGQQPGDVAAAVAALRAGAETSSPPGVASVAKGPARPHPVL